MDRKQRLAVGMASAALVLCGLLWPAVAKAQICPSPAQPPQVTFTADTGRVVYGRQLTVRGLDDMRRQQGQVTGLSGAAVGLTVADLSRSLQIGTEVRPSGQGRSCVYLRMVEATIGYGQIRVYVARDYRPGSCPDNVIVAHENRHVAVFRETLARYAPNLRQTIEGTARRQGPLVVGRGADAEAIFLDRLQQAIAPLLNRMIREMDRANAAIDSPTSYAGEQARCADW
jgi:hypothetical protein